MTIAFWCVFIAGLLPYIATLAAKIGAGGYDNKEPRRWLARQEGFRARANAAQQNGFEAFALFAAAVLMARVAHGPQARVDMLAMAFIAARVVYLPVYLAGWGDMRSLVWSAGFIATTWIFLVAAGLG
ncbi:MAG: MAPEG family protein [Pseudomonadota bacterium]